MVGPNRRHVLAGAAAAVAAALAGSRSVAQSAAGQHHQVAIKSFAFEPQDLTVKVGDSITWTNHDLAPHTATDVDRGWDTGELRQSKTQTLTVTQDMAGEYFCTFHPHMRAHLIIAG